MNKLDDRMPIPPKDTMNIGLTAVLEATMLKKFGPPGRTDPKCGDPSPKMSKRMLFGVKIGPMKVSGLDFAVHSLQQILGSLPEKYADYGVGEFDRLARVLQVSPFDRYGSTCDIYKLLQAVDKLQKLFYE